MFPQVIVDPTVSPTLNNGGWVYNAAVLLAAAGLLIAVVLVFGYMRFAPRFQTEEGARTSVRAPRVQPGKDVRRPVNVTSAPLVVQPPSVAVGSGAASGSGSAPPVPSMVAPAAGGGASHSLSAATPAPATDATPPPATAAAPAPATEATSAPATAVEAPAPAAAAPATAATSERPEVSLDEETFEATLTELLAKGTDRRVAEGQARRAAMLAARKKAGG